MTLISMLDANLCIRVLRDRPMHIATRFRQEAPQLGISTIVLHELHYGAARSDRPEYQHKQVDDFTRNITICDFDRAAAQEAAEIKAVLAMAGKLIGPNDILIAGHARSLGLTLITGKLGEFSRVEGLRCEDWLG